MKENLPAKQPQSGKGMSRRSFFKATALGATLGAVTSATRKDDLMVGSAQAVTVQEHDEFPMKILDSYERFPQRNLMFSRAWGQHEPGHMEQGLKFLKMEPRDEPGWTQLERALDQAAWSIHDNFSPLSSAGVPKSPAFAWDLPVAENKFKFKDKKQATKYVKRTARLLGASLVGVCRYDPRWVYDPLYDLRTDTEIEPDFPFEPKSVVVMALEMDYDSFSTAPSWIASAAAGKMYSQMAVSAHSVAKFIRDLGYKAFGAGNDVAMSIPLAVAAGLGECSRMGTLVTYEYGPRVRLCKVFTELELEYDKPKTFGVVEFCKRCMRCADACPSKAISHDPEPSFKGPNRSSSNGVEKWYIDSEKCFKFWGDNGGDCGSCIASCVYNKPDFWHHKMMVAMTAAAPGPLHSFMREMDILFGYGNTFDKKSIKKWWDA